MIAAEGSLGPIWIVLGGVVLVGAMVAETLISHWRDHRRVSAPGSSSQRETDGEWEMDQLGYLLRARGMSWDVDLARRVDSAFTTFYDQDAEV